MGIMALWIPKHDEPVGSNERIGRRLFERQNLMGAKDQKPVVGFALYHFEESRGNGQVSIDRMGNSGNVDRKVKNILLALCNDAGPKFKPPKNFTGWATATAKRLQNPKRGPKISIAASPLAAAADSSAAGNPYHAHLDRPEHYTDYEMAFHLKAIFDSESSFEPAESDAAAQQPVATPAPESQPAPVALAEVPPLTWMRLAAARCRNFFNRT